MTVRERSVARLTCKANGTPTPEIRWIRNGQYHSGSSLTQDGILELDLGTVSRLDGGVYTCEAKNRAGKTRKNTTLDVLCKLQPLCTVCVYAAVD